MPTTFPPTQHAFPPEPAPNRKRWTRRECEILVEKELLTGRYELIDGTIISKMGEKPPHCYVVTVLHIWLSSVFGGLFAQCLNPIDVGNADPEHNEPEPDAAVTKQPTTAYYDRHPGPNDLVLVAEVSDTTLRFDLATKAALYARAGIREYWVVDISRRRIFIHHVPTPQGYKRIMAYDASESIATLTHPNAAIIVSQLLPPERKV